MRKRSVILFGVLGCVLLVLSLTIFAFPGESRIIEIIQGSIRKFLSPRNNLVELLNEADSKLSLGYYTSAKGVLKKAVNTAYSREQLLKVLKRGYFLYTNTGDKSFWVELCKRAWRKVQAREIGLLYVYALMEKDDYGAASKILAGLKLPRKSGLSNFKDLLMVSLAVKAGYNAEGIQNKGLAALYKAMKQPVNVSAADLESIGREYSGAVLLDSILLWAKEGFVSRAYSILRNSDILHSGGNLSKIKELAIYLSYDAGDFESTIERIDDYLVSIDPNRTDLILLKADALLQLGRTDEARLVYRGVVKNTPHYSWIPYYNLARIDELRGNLNGAIKILERGVGNFVENKNLILYLVDLYVRVGNIEGAKLLVESYREKFPNDSGFALEDLQLNISNYSPVRYSAELWNLFNKNQGNPAVARSLFIYLYGINDYTGAKEVLDRFVQSTNGNNIPWVLHFYGLLDAALGKLKEAQEKLERSLEYKNDWEVRYNLALVEVWMKEYDNALNDYNRLLAQFGGSEFSCHGFEKRKILSKIRYYRAIIYYQQEKFDLCRRELKYSLELDKTNTKSMLLLRKVNLEANLK